MLDETPVAVLETVLGRLNDALARGDAKGAAALFQADSYWRDLVAFTWNIRTMEGPDQILAMLESQLPKIKPGALRLDPKEAPATSGDVTEGWIGFETEVGRGYGHIRVKDGLIWTLLTTLVELKGFEEPKGRQRPMGAEHGHDPNRRTWKEKREQEAAELGYATQPEVVIIGGGQGAIGLGARLRQLGVPTVIIEKNERPGDSWRKRYKSLCLHDPVWYDHLPYIPFPENWPVFSPKDKIGDWLEWYTKVMELNYWSSTTAKKAEWDAAKKEWVVTVDRDGEEVVLRPKQLVLATGMSGKPNIPKLPGQDIFKGEQQHSSQHPGPDAYKGKKVVVIGSNNSAHDICAALWEGGADVTMVQRSSTHIVRSDTLMEIGLGALYSEEAVANGISTGKADLIFASVPYRILHEFQIPLYSQMKERDAEFYRQLEDAGFWLDWGPDDSGLFMKYLRRGIGLLHRRWRKPAHHRRQDQAQARAGGEADRGRGGAGGRHRIAGRFGSLCNGLRVNERLGGGPDQPGGGGQGRQGAGGWGRTRRRTRGRGRASNATCGSRRRSRRCGSMAVTCTRAGIIRSSSPCSSRRGWRGCRRRSGGCRRCTTRGEFRWWGRAGPNLLRPLPPWISVASIRYLAPRRPPLPVGAYVQRCNPRPYVIPSRILPPRRSAFRRRCGTLEQS